MAAVKQISMDASVVAVLAKLASIFPFKESCNVMFTFIPTGFGKNLVSYRAM